MIRRWHCLHLNLGNEPTQKQNHMAHGIESTDTMISVGTTPWHGLGTVLATPPATTAEALKMAGLDWTVHTERARHTFYDPAAADPSDDANAVIARVETIPAQVVVRDDTRTQLGVVGLRWTPVQNVDAFGWFDRWVDTGKVQIETAGSLFGGRKVWILARIVSDPIVIGPDDEIRKFVLLAHGHDGQLAIRVGTTLVRVVCNNTMSAAVSLGDGDGSLMKIAHTSGALARLDDAADQIEMIDARLSEAGEAYRELARHDVTGGEQTIVDYVGAVYGQSEDDVRKGRRLPLIEEKFARGLGQDLKGARGTWFGLLNAITEAETHGRTGKPSESRAIRNVWGTGAAVLARALDVALASVRGMLLPMRAPEPVAEDDTAG
jgi:phage/plasmid-like protein (TIGR03299 family)